MPASTPSPAASATASRVAGPGRVAQRAGQHRPDHRPGGSGDRPDLAAASLAVDVVTDQLESPLWVDRVPDGSGRLAVGEQGGTIRIVDGGRLLPDPYLDITDRVEAGGERGLLGVAFPPGFGGEHQTLFVHYSDRNGDTTISAFDAPGRQHDRRPGERADPAVGRAALRQPQRRLHRVRLDRDAADRPGRRRRRRRPREPGLEPRRAAGQDAPDRRPERRRRAVRDPARQPVRRSGRRPPRGPPLRAAQPVPRQRRPGDRRPVDRRRGPERVGGGRRRACRRERPRLRLATVGGQPLLQPEPGLRPGGRDDAGDRVPAQPGLLGHRRRRLSRRGDPGVEGRLPVLRQLLRDPVGDRRGARRAPGADHAAGDRTARSAGSGSTTRERSTSPTSAARS